MNKTSLKDGWQDLPEFRNDETVHEGLSGIDFASIRGIIWRQRFVLSSIIVGTLVLGFIITLLMVPIYRATATVKVDPNPMDIIEGQETLTMNSRDLRTYKLTLAEVVKSRSMAIKVASDPALRSNLLNTQDEKPANMSDKAWAQQKLDAAVNGLQAGLTVDIPEDASIISINFSSKDPGLAAQIANTYTSYFLKDDLERNLAQSEYARDYLLDQIQKLQGKLANAERQSISYARTAKIVSPGMLGAGTEGADSGSGESLSAAPQTISGSNLMAINEAYTAARTARIAAEQRWKSASAIDALSLPEVQQNQTIQGLINDRSKAAANLADLNTRYGDDYPQAQELKARIASLDKQIRLLSASVKSTLRSNYETAARQEEALANEVGKVSDATLNEQSRRVQFGQLERETSAYRKQLDAMLTRYNELSATANIKSSNITKLDAAIAPSKPVSPNLIKNLMIAGILGLGLAIAIAIVREFFDDRLRSIADLERKLGVPTLGVTPKVDEVVFGKESAALDEAYSSVCTALEFALPARDHCVVSLTSSQNGEGKSTTSFIIAKKLARHGRKVLLIDADLRKPSIAAVTGNARPKIGLTEVLLGASSLEAAFLPNIAPDLDILPTGAVPAQPVEVLSSPLFAELLEKCRDQYALVVIDSPPVMGLADSPIIARVADCTVFVVEANRAHFGQAKTAMRRLRDAGANVVGAVLTKFESLSAGQSYDYQYSYYTYGKD